MKKISLNGLKKIYTSIKDASEKNVKDYPYSEKRELFREKLKEVLKFIYGDAIVFEDETFAYVKCKYEGTGIEINFFDGIILSVDSYEKASEIKDKFNYLFSYITDCEMICEYDFLYAGDEKVSVTKTYEWSCFPARRMYEVVNGYNCSGFGNFETNVNLADYYHMNIIHDLGDKLLTIDGYMTLFGHSYITNSRYVKHIFKLIMLDRPDICEEMIYKWYRDCYSKFSRKLY